MAPLATDWAQLLLTPVWGIVVIALALALAWLLRGPLTRVLRDLGVSRVSFLGIDVEWVATQARGAYEARGLPPPLAATLRSFATLSVSLAPLVHGRRILWVDDQPAGNRMETRLLRKLGVDVENAIDTTTAFTWLTNDPARFDLVISDWARQGDEDGLELLTQMRATKLDHPVLFYVGDASPDRRGRAAAWGALGVTAMPDELLKHALVELATAA
jgi:CheY-like chemotaxis protein